MEFYLREDGVAIMELPKTYLADLATLLKPLEQGTGNIPLNEALSTVGKAGRVSQVINEARPFTGTLYATYTAAVKQNLIGPRQAPHRQAPCSRFSTAAKWLRLLISGEGNELVPLRQEASHFKRATATMNDIVFQEDASPWGGGQH